VNYSVRIKHEFQIVHFILSFPRVFNVKNNIFDKILKKKTKPNSTNRSTAKIAFICVVIQWGFIGNINPFLPRDTPVYYMHFTESTIDVTEYRSVDRLW